jgi:hypothetical protein
MLAVQYQWAMVILPLFFGGAAAQVPASRGDRTNKTKKRQSKSAPALIEHFSNKEKKNRNSRKQQPLS